MQVYTCISAAPCVKTVLSRSSTARSVNASPGIAWHADHPHLLARDLRITEGGSTLSHNVLTQRCLEAGSGLAGRPDVGMQWQPEPHPAGLLRRHQRGPAGGAVHQGQGLHAAGRLGARHQGACPVTLGHWTLQWSHHPPNVLVTSSIACRSACFPQCAWPATRHTVLKRPQRQLPFAVPRLPVSPTRRMGNPLVSCARCFHIVGLQLNHGLTGSI